MFFCVLLCRPGFGMPQNRMSSGDFTAPSGYYILNQFLRYVKCIVDIMSISIIYGCAEGDIMLKFREGH